jgi:TonB-linked SusC/RagA family outer membrane protein
MKKVYVTTFLSALLMLHFAVVQAQERLVSGTVSDESGAALPGVNVVVRGTSTGTTTDINGRYSLSVSSGTATLVFSFIGYASQEVEVANRTTIDVRLATDVQELQEVVVTALGIERNTKALQSSVTQVSGDNFTQARENSFANALAGRIAGVNVTKVSSGPASSSRVVIRGAKTLGSNLNQPLYVVDGVPITNNNYGQAGVWGGADQGDGMASINPDDIESTTVLKGASAAALYGSRAANGVILITTKKGASRKGMGIEFNSNYVFEKVMDLRDLQTTHGSGAMVGPTLDTRVATKATDPNNQQDLNNAFSGWGAQGWGPRLDGSNVLQFDGVVRKYSNAGDNWKRYYETGTSFTNSLAFTAGNENQNFRFSIADLKSTSIIPNSGFDRFNVGMSTNSKFGKKLTLNSSILYSNEKAKNRPRVSDSPGNGVQALWLTPADVNVNNYIGDPNKPGAVPSVADQQAGGITIIDGKAPGEEFQRSTNLWGQNPWWTAYQFKNTDKRDRVIANGVLRYNILDFLYIQGRGGMDWSTSRLTQLIPEGTGYQRGGAMSEWETRIREINLEYLVGFDKTFDRIGVNTFFGGNRMRASWERIEANGNGFNIPFFAAINNARDRNYGYGVAESGINSIFASAEVSYNSYLFVTATWRRDWFSQLNPEKNSITYPSVGLSFVFSDAFSGLPSWLSFGKVRASWAQVGNANSVGAYQTKLTYSLGVPHLGRPLATYSSGSNLPNQDLIPFTSTETEFGFDLRFLNNRIGLDITYYSQKTTDDILNAGVSRASGFATTSVNLGELTNKGIEFLLTGTPLKQKLTWNVSLNFAKNNNEVVSLIEGQDRLFVEEPRTRTAAVYHVVGHPFGMILGLTQRRSPDGQLVYDQNGAPLTDNTYQILGNGVPDFTGGLTNEFVYRNFVLNFLIDFKSGGDIYAGTEVRLTQAGFHKQTLQGREGEAPLTVTGVTPDGENFIPFTKTLTPGEAQNYWSQLGNRAQENFMYDASFVKLRQVTFGYNVPRSILSRTPINTLNVSFVGRNLAILFKNTDNIDPESSYTSSNAQGLDYFGMPPTRTYGFNLRATF